MLTHDTSKSYSNIFRWKKLRKNNKCIYGGCRTKNVVNFTTKNRRKEQPRDATQSRDATIKRAMGTGTEETGTGT